MNEPELNGLSEQPEILVSQNNDSNGEDLIINTTEAKKRNAPKYKQMYEEAKAEASWRLAGFRVAIIIAALGWSAFIITILTK